MNKKRNPSHHVKDFISDLCVGEVKQELIDYVGEAQYANDVIDNPRFTETDVRKLMIAFGAKVKAPRPEDKDANQSEEMTAIKAELAELKAIIKGYSKPSVDAPNTVGSPKKVSAKKDGK